MTINLLFTTYIRNKCKIYKIFRSINMIRYEYFVILFCIIHLSYANLRNESPEYQKFINQAGYNFEEYSITAEDGYILSIWRIPSVITQRNANPTPIILQHGLLDDSWTWFMLKDKRSLPYLLVDSGYDVWVPNIRGNMFSMGNTDSTKDSRNPFGPYWNFSFSDMSDYDLPAFVNFIKSRTGFDKIDYIGHSQGTTIFFLKYMADQQFIQNNIKKFVAIGPVPSVSYISSKIVKFLAEKTRFKKYYPLLNALNLGKTMGKLFSIICGKLYSVCQLVVESIAAEGITGRINYQDIAKLYLFEPGGTSKQNVKHWLQCYTNKRMERFDFGKEENMKKYGTEYPPVYDTNILKKWDIDTFMTVSNTDPFSSETDVYNFINNVEDQSKIQVLKLNNYNHLDYLWAECSKEEIYDPILEFLQKDN